MSLSSPRKECRTVWDCHLYRVSLPCSFTGNYCIHLLLTNQKADTHFTILQKTKDRDDLRGWFNTEKQQSTIPVQCVNSSQYGVTIKHSTKRLIHREKMPPTKSVQTYLCIKQSSQKLINKVVINTKKSLKKCMLRKNIETQKELKK